MKNETDNLNKLLEKFDSLLSGDIDDQEMESVLDNIVTEFEGSSEEFNPEKFDVDPINIEVTNDTNNPVVFNKDNSITLYSNEEFFLNNGLSRWVDVGVKISLPENTIPVFKPYTYNKSFSIINHKEDETLQLEIVNYVSCEFKQNEPFAKLYLVPVYNQKFLKLTND